MTRLPTLTLLLATLLPATLAVTSTAPPTAEARLLGCCKSGCGC